jgi:hypothetical protein
VIFINLFHALFSLFISDKIRERTAFSSHFWKT